MTEIAGRRVPCPQRGNHIIIRREVSVLPEKQEKREAGNVEVDEGGYSGDDIDGREINSGSDCFDAGDWLQVLHA